ncbi:MAG: hypothetical protein V4666_08500 [Bacteroidota bacterium]
MEKLISNTEFGFYVRSLEVNEHKKLELRENYDAFLKQTLSLGMFIPCKLKDGVWVVLEEPKIYSQWLIKGKGYDFLGKENIECKEYQEAKYRVLFEGFRQNIFNSTGSFEIINESGFQVCAYKALPKYFLWLGCPEERTVESALKFHEFILTPSAQKQIL